MCVIESAIRMSRRSLCVAVSVFRSIARRLRPSVCVLERNREKRAEACDKMCVCVCVCVCVRVRERERERDRFRYIVLLLS